MKELLSPDSSTENADLCKAALKTLLLSDLVDSTKLVETLGDHAAAQLFAAHDRIARDLLRPHKGQEIDKTDGFLLLFDRPLDAVLYALDYHEALKKLAPELEVPLASRIGIHVGEVFLHSNSPEDVSRGAKAIEVEGLAKPMAARLMSLAGAGQTLLTAAAFELARRAAVSRNAEEVSLQWLVHGAYLFKGVSEAVQVFEVGIPGISPLKAPEGSTKVQKADEQGLVLGWRPAPGQGLPERPNWILEKKLGEGGFGEVWLGKHRKTGDEHVFKFCFDGERLRSLQREVTLFRLIRESLGNREDIARILDWNFDESPFFLEIEFSEGGSFEDWARRQGGIATVPLETRLEIVAQVAVALAAAHSVGVLHKDLKPANILIGTDIEGGPRARLTDFGISAITDPSRAMAAGITMLGFTGPMAEDTAFSGTRIYMAPELLEGKPASIQADLYSLGILLYQVVAGDLHRALATGWERDIQDPLLLEDIAVLVDRSPERRPGDAAEIARRLRTLKERRAIREEEARQREEGILAKKALVRARKRRRILTTVAAGLALFAATMGYQRMRIAEEATRAEENALLARQQEETTRRVLNYLLNIFDAADPARSRGRTISVREVLDRGAGRISEELKGEPQVQARVMESLGAVYFKLGEYDRAEKLWDSSLELRQSLGETAAPELASDLMSLASVKITSGALPEAEKLLHTALEMAKETGQKKLQADIEANLGSIAFYQRGYSEAELSWTKALKIFEADEDTPTLKKAQLMNNIAQAEREQGRLEEARKTLSGALKLLMDSEGSDHPEVARISSGLGDLALLQGLSAQAGKHYQQALEVRRKVLPADHPLIASSLQKLARARARDGNGVEAETLARSALEMAEKKLGDHHPLSIECRVTLSDVFLLAGNPSGAVVEAEKVLKILHSENDPMKSAPALRILGLAEYASNHPDRAHEILDPLVTMYREKLPGSLDLADAEAALAEVLLEQGEKTQARELLKDALKIRRNTAGARAPVSTKTAADLAAVEGA